MHSFQASRGRVLFEVLCALTIAASCAAAWMQTGASALLGAAGVAALYGLVHLFDMRRPTPVHAAEPQRVDFEPVAPEIILPKAAAAEQAADACVAEEPAALEPVPSRASSGRRSGGSRKGNGRRARTPKAGEIAELAPAEEAETPRPTAEAASLPEVASAKAEEFASVPQMEAAHPHIAPLFEPEPFARMPRPAFGRRGRL